MWSFAEDLDTFEHAVVELFSLTVGSVSFGFECTVQGLCTHLYSYGVSRTSTMIYQIL